jgi:hypothetical protein
MFRPSRLPSPATLIAVVALIIALGGTSYAAISLPKNSVGTKQIRKGGGDQVQDPSQRDHVIEGEEPVASGQGLQGRPAARRA